jgi:hypothetical protein
MAAICDFPPEAAIQQTTLITVIESHKKPKSRRDLFNVSPYIVGVENRAAGWWLLRPLQLVLLCLGAIEPSSV